MCLSNNREDSTPRLKTTPLTFTRRSEAEMIDRSRSFLEMIRSRRSVRHFSSDLIPREALQNCLEAAGQAPSGAHKQPWTYVLVTDPDVKRRIRVAAEKEEWEHYHGRAPEQWLNDLEPLGTNENKPFLESAPALIVVFAQRHGATPQEQHYYVTESIGLSVGFLLAALHHAGFATLTHTPSPMKFLSDILKRPSNERAFLLIPVGFPVEGCRVPDIQRKKVDEYTEEV